MGLSSRLLRPWAPLLAALCLPAPAAEGAAAATCGAPSDRSSAKALELVAQGLCFSAASDNDMAEWAFLQAVELDPALFIACEGLAEQQRRRGLPRLAVRTLLDGARAARGRENWRTAVRAAAELAHSPTKEVGADVAIMDRESFREAVRGLAACPGEPSAEDEALLAAGFLHADDLPEAARHFLALLRKLPTGAAPSGPQRALYARLMRTIAESPSLPLSEKGPLAASLAEAMLAAAPDWDRAETARLVAQSLPGGNAFSGLRLSLLPEIQRLDPETALPAFAYALGLLGETPLLEADESLRAAFRETEPPNPDIAYHLHILSAEWSSRLKEPEESLRDLDLAREAWEAARPGEPLPAIHAATLASALWAAGDTNGTVRAYEAGLADHPADPELNNDLAYLLAEANEQLDRALELADAALVARPLEPAFLDTLGWILHRQGREDEALDTFRKARDLTPSGDPEMFGHIAEVLDALGRPEDAAEWRRRIRDGDLEQDETSNDK